MGHPMKSFHDQPHLLCEFIQGHESTLPFLWGHHSLFPSSPGVAECPANWLMPAPLFILEDKEEVPCTVVNMLLRDPGRM